MSDDIKLKKRYETAIEAAIRDGFDRECGIRYAVNEICAEHFLETGKDVRKMIRKAQDVLCGMEVYEHPRKPRGWFSFSAAWRDLLWNNLDIENFCSLAGLSLSSSHLDVFRKIWHNTEDGIERGAKIYFYCLSRMPFEYANAVAGRVLSSRAMQNGKLGIFSGNSRGLCDFRESLNKINERIRKGKEDEAAFRDLLDLWRKSRMLNLRDAFEMVEIWNDARLKLGCEKNEALKFYMMAFDDYGVRDIAEWSRMTFVSPESVRERLFSLLDSGLAVERKRGYEILARSRMGGFHSA